MALAKAKSLALKGSLEAFNAYQRAAFSTSGANMKYFGFFSRVPKPKKGEEELGFPDEMDMAQGMWKKELTARLAGDPDPWKIGAIKRSDFPGTYLEPIMVPSALESRMVACRCEPDAHQVLYFWLHRGEKTRCRCGFWMQLYQVPQFMEVKYPY